MRVGKNESVVHLWTDDSLEAKALIASFKEKGYEVNSIFSGSLRPEAYHPSGFITGYAHIRTYFSLLDKRAH